jgi:putative membrane protein (TIGR04086 family)
MRTKRKFGRAAANAFTLLISAVCGFAAVFVCILVFSFVMTKIDLSDSVISVLTSLALCVGAYVGGYVASRRRRKNGLAAGALCGLVIFAVIFVLSYFFAGTAGGFSGSSKLAMTLVCAGIGGIVGVNTGGRRFKL